MSDYLISDALRRVWCTPDQDNQVILKPARITPINGVWGKFRVMWTSIQLPDALSHFHLYQIGQVHPLILNLVDYGDVWTSFAQACNAGKCIIDIYTTAGIQLPRTQTWYRITKENTIVVAVKQNDTDGFSFNNDAVYLRLYTNAYFNSSRTIGRLEAIAVTGGTMRSTDDILALQTSFLASAQLPGGTYAFVNGFKVGAITLQSVKVGDIAEYVYDSSILRVIDFKLTALATFDSVLDSKGKYLLHYTGSDDATIDYLDDIDLFLIDTTTQKGVYVHKNAADTLRMLSHRDYAIPVAYVEAYLPSFLVDGVVNRDNLYLRMHVRKSGYLRPLILEHHRINELYKLPDSDLVNAVLGLQSNVPVWTAASLESSSYPAVMGSSCCTIDNTLVKNAYGYNAVAKLVADTPAAVSVAQGVKFVPARYLQATDATAFEYDSNGLLLEWHRHTGGSTYICTNPQAALVEMVIGEGTQTLDENYSSATVGTPLPYRYRFYSAPVLNGAELTDWQDVSNTSQYTAGSNQAVWAVDTAQHRLVRSDKKFLLYQEDLLSTDGLLLFTLASIQTRNGLTQLRNLEVPLGELDVFMNGYSLIEGLDYYLNFPNIAIVNKSHLINPLTQAQKIVVRFTGFCDDALQLTSNNEFGFIQQGKISVNNHFDIHDGKVLRIVCAGALKLRETFVFAEGGLAGNAFSPNNGQPYLIRDMVVPMRSLVPDYTYAYRALSLQVDQSVAAYLTLKLPESAPAAVNPISSRYALYSPFLCKITFALLAGLFPTDTLAGQYSDVVVRELCASYEYLLAFDPIQIDHLQNPDYVVVHPHFLTTEINLDLPRYRFISRVVALYANNQVSLSSFIKLV